MSSNPAKRFTPRFKFQIVLENFSIHRRKKEFLEKGPEIFSQDTTIHEYEKKIADLERLIGHKEVEVALLKNFLTGTSPERTK